MRQHQMKGFVWLLTVVAESKFKQIVTLGDGFSDTGLASKLTQGSVPGKPYYMGRFSNGPVWTEYLAEELNATLFNYAVGMATSDNTVYPVSDEIEIPGCVQQAQSLASSCHIAKIKALPEETLVTMAFFGGDFAMPGASVDKTMDALNRCLELLVKTSGAKHFLIPTSHNPVLLPLASERPAYIRDLLTAFSSKVQEQWSTTLETFNQWYPNITFHPYDFKVEKTSHPLFKDTSNSCLFFEPKDPTTPKECDNPHDHLFYNELYLTTDGHRALANSVKASLFPTRCSS